jgi:GTP-dependent phosphoenolpyruvate carboxykinase
VKTPIGYVPIFESLDLTGLSVSGLVRQGWRGEHMLFMGVEDFTFICITQ